MTAKRLKPGRLRPRSGPVFTEIVEQVERDLPGGNTELLNAFKSSRERFETLAVILKSAEARQLSAASVLELRLLGGVKPETLH